MIRIALLAGSLVGLVGCDPCAGRVCPEPEPWRTGTWEVSLADGELEGVAEVTADTVELIYTDADRDTWRVRWTHTELDDGTGL